MDRLKWLKGFGVLFILSALIVPIHGCATGGAKPATGVPSAENSVTLGPVKELEDRTVIAITGNTALNYTPYRLETPLRLVVDIPDAVFVEPNVDVEVGNDTISKMSKLDMTSDGKKVARLEIYLVQDTNYFITKPSDSQIQVEIQKPTGAVGEETTPSKIVSEPTKTTFPPAKKIINIVADDTSDGTLVTVLTDGSVENFESFVLETPYRLVVDVKGLKNDFPSKEIKVGGSDIKAIRVGTYPDKTRVVLESAIPGKLNTYNVFPYDNKLMISFRKAGEALLGSIPPPAHAAPPAPTPEVTAPEVTTPEVTTPAPAEPTVKLPATVPGPGTELAQPSGTTPSAPATLPGEAGPSVESPVVPPGMEPTAPSGAAPGEKIFTGKPMTLIFSNAKVKDLINLIAEFSNVSIVIKPDVPDDLKLSLRLKKVPWDQALDLIVSLSGLGMVQRGNVIIVTTQAKLNEEIQAEYKFKKNLEDDAPLVTRQVNVIYRKNPTPLMTPGGGITTTTPTATPTGTTYTTGAPGGTSTTTIVDIVAAITNAKMLSTRGSIAWAPSGDMIIVTDTQERVDKIIEMVHLLDTPDKEPEVRIEARIVEVDDNYQQELGIKWVAGYNGGDKGGSIKSSLGWSDTANINNADNFDITKTIFPNLPLTSLGAVGGASAMIGFLDNALRLDVQLHALESLGEANIIESPKVRVLNNATATLDITTSIPQSNPTESTNETGTVTLTSTIEYKDFSTTLVITPTVEPDGKIKLDLNLTHNTQGDPVKLLNTSGVENTYFTELKKNLITKVLVDNRDTIVIGGLYRKTSNSTDTGLPALKDIPLLGWLFKTRSVSDVRRELLIFITPTIVREQDELTKGQ